MITKIRNFFNRYWLVIAWIAMIFTILLLGGCRTVKMEYIERNDSIYIDKIVYKDSTIFVDVPKEKIVELVPMLDTLRMETSVALSTCWLDTCSYTLKGELRNKETSLKKDISMPTRYITNTITKTVTNTKTIYKKPSFWSKIKYFVFGFLFFLLLVIIAYIFKRFKG